MIKKKEIVAEELLDVLACPACKGDIELTEYEEDKYGIECLKCKHIYPIKDGIPIMLIDEAIKK